MSEKRSQNQENVVDRLVMIAMRQMKALKDEGLTRVYHLVTFALMATVIGRNGLKTRSGANVMGARECLESCVLSAKYIYVFTRLRIVFFLSTLANNSNYL